jgi:hypothetical protein
VGRQARPATVDGGSSAGSVYPSCGEVRAIFSGRGLSGCTGSCNRMPADQSLHDAADASPSADCGHAGAPGARAGTPRLRASAVALVGLLACGSVGLGACGPAATHPVPVPGTPSHVVAVPRDTAAVVSWNGLSLPAGRLSGFRATAEPGGRSCTAGRTGTSCAVRGLQNGRSYAIGVRAFGPGGDGAASTPIPMTPGVPGPPGNVTESPGDGSVSVRWSAEGDNGSAVTRQVATSSPGGHTCTTGPTSGCTIFGLTNGTAYTVSVVAANARGTGPPSVATDPVIPQLDAGGSAGITYLGPVLARGESLTASLQRDAGMSVPLPNGKDLWIFGDTGEFVDTGGWVSNGFVGGSTIAKGGNSRGRVPKTLKNASVHGALRSEGGPTQFLPTPTDVYLPDGSRRRCGVSNGTSYSARWPTGAALLDPSTVLVSYVDVCVLSSTSSSAEGWGIAEYGWRNNRLRAGPFDVIAPTVDGAQISPAQSLGSPVVADGRVTFFSSACPHLFVACPSGSVFETSVVDAADALENPMSYAPRAVSVSDPTGWQPMGISVSPDPNGSFTLVEQTSIGGSFRLFGASTVGGPWLPGGSGILPGCSSSPHGFCYAFVGHPELSSSTQYVVSYFKPDAGPDPMAGHLVLASVPLGVDPHA